MKIEKITKYIWELEDISASLYVIRDDSPIDSENTSFARTVTFKIGYIHQKDGQYYGKCNCLTDGWFYITGKDKQSVVDHLNSDKRGYRPLTKEEYIRLVEFSNQGFLTI